MFIGLLGGIRGFLDQVDLCPSATQHRAIVVVGGLPPNLHKNLLEQVLGIGPIAEEAHGERKDEGGRARLDAAATQKSGGLEG